MKQKEIILLEKQAVDMGRQINGLLAHVAHLEDPSLPDEYTDEPPTEGVLDSDAFISSNLVLFKNSRHLREQNQVLLKLSRKLGAQLEERERIVAQAEETEIMAEARQLIESLQKELLNASTKAESYVRERDMFKSMLGRSQNSLGSGTTTISLVPGAPDYHKMYDEEHAMLEELRQKWNKELANLRDDIEKGRVGRDRLNQTINQLKSQVDFHKRMTGVVCVKTVLLISHQMLNSLPRTPMPDSLKRLWLSQVGIESCKYCCEKRSPRSVRSLAPLPRCLQRWMHWSARLIYSRARRRS